MSARVPSPLGSLDTASLTRVRMVTAAGLTAASITCGFGRADSGAAVAVLLMAGPTTAV